MIRSENRHDIISDYNLLKFKLESELESYHLSALSIVETRCSRLCLASLSRCRDAMLASLVCFEAMLRREHLRREHRVSTGINYSDPK